MKKKHFNIPIFIPELACPFRCLYCNQCKISGVQHTPDEALIIGTLESYLQTIPAGSEVQLAYFGGNFTGLSLDDQANYLKLAAPYIAAGRISGIRLSTRPDYINDEVLQLLKNHGVESIELGAQSMDEQVLQASGRGHTAQDTEIAAEKIRKAGFSLGLQMMIGLPGDNREKSVQTAKQIITMGAEDTRIYPTLVIRGTELEKMYLTKQYHPLTLDEAVGQAKELLLLFEQAGVKVLKLGLHPSDGLLSGEELVAGPFHPSFRELVETQVWNELLETYKLCKGQLIHIVVPTKQLNTAIGYQALNKKMLETAFKKVRFEPSDELSGRDFSVTTV